MGIPADPQLLYGHVSHMALVDYVQVITIFIPHLMYHFTSCVGGVVCP